MTYLNILRREGHPMTHIQKHSQTLKANESLSCLCVYFSTLTFSTPDGLRCGPRLLESIVRNLRSASWAALWHKICGRVHWEPKTWSLESYWKKNEEVIQICLKLVSWLDFNIINQLSTTEFHQYYLGWKDIKKNWKKTSAQYVCSLEYFLTYSSQMRMK